MSGSSGLCWSSECNPTVSDNVLEIPAVGMMDSILREIQFSKMAYLQRQLGYLGYSQWTWEIEEEQCWGISLENARLSGQAYFFYDGEVDYIVGLWDGPGHPRGLGKSIDEQKLLEMLEVNSEHKSHVDDFTPVDRRRNASDEPFRWPSPRPASVAGS